MTSGHRGPRLKIDVAASVGLISVLIVAMVVVVSRFGEAGPGRPVRAAVVAPVTATATATTTVTAQPKPGVMARQLKPLKDLARGDKVLLWRPDKPKPKVCMFIAWSGDLDFSDIICQGDPLSINVHTAYLTPEVLVGPE